ncbi:hypothetical protein RZ532_16885 [Nitratireductor aquimarinus]|uniref:hypothetical protein n=1 Tax=Nitratireductor aquimarinus TaxID=889300 RepID=UPI0029359D96|nr:hypothetical protein [Nitratireductor aquimarinus]MDV2967668.1 hypothetical protein [Nitratireductor aquimarinus]
MRAFRADGSEHDQSNIDLLSAHATLAESPGDRLVTLLPWLLLTAAIILAAGLLSLPLRAPIGAMYWDAFTYFDAANRILTGQIPTLDFFTPAGPLGYTVAAIWIAVFPNG